MLGGREMQRINKLKPAYVEIISDFIEVVCVSTYLKEETIQNDHI